MRVKLPEASTLSEATSKIMYYIGRRPTDPTPPRGVGQGGGFGTVTTDKGLAVWTRKGRKPTEKGVFLSPDPFRVAREHGRSGNLYAYRVPVDVIKASGGVRVYDNAPELLIPAELWPRVKFLGKKMDRVEFAQKAERAWTKSRYDQNVKIKFGKYLQRQGLGGLGETQATIQRGARYAGAMRLTDARLIIAEAYTLGGRVTPGIARVKDAVFFWGGRSPGLPIGAKVPVFSGRLWKGSEKHRFLEEQFERVRKQVNPQAPPRVGSVMLAPTLGEGFSSGSRREGVVHAVRATGKTFTADAEMWTEAVMNVGGWSDKFTPSLRWEDEADVWARAYWKGTDISSSGYNEVLLDGTAIVIAHVDPKTGAVLGKSLE